MSPLPTGTGEQRGQEDAGEVGTALPSRPARAKANDAMAVEGYGCAPDNSHTGAVEMEVTVPWATGGPVSWPGRDEVDKDPHRG